MAYFSNSTEADVFQHNWCSRCRNWRDRTDEGHDAEGEGCPLMDLHFVYQADDDAASWLDELITDTSPPAPLAGRRCHLFVKGGPR